MKITAKITAILAAALLGLSSGLAIAAPVTTPEAAPAASTAAPTAVVRVAGGLYRSRCPPPQPHMLRACPIIRRTGWKPLPDS